MTFKINTLENALNQMSGQLRQTTTFVERWIDIDNNSFNSAKLRTSDEHKEQQLTRINFNHDTNDSSADMRTSEF